MCDTDTESETNDKTSSDAKSLVGMRLSFSDDDSSGTSEFDPGDYVPPKPISKKSEKRNTCVQIFEER